MDTPELSSYMAYEPPESLWKLVEESISLEERAEIREILGDSLVDQSLELHTEADALLEIWQSFKCETDNAAPEGPKPLSEPPGMRDSLRDHIKMLVDSIREKAKNVGRDSEFLLSQHKSDIIDYAMDGSSRGSSPGCVRSRPSSSSFSSRSGRETPMRMTPSSEEDRLSGSTCASEKVDSVRDRLNVLKIDEVVQELRGVLQDEVSQLHSDIQFLQNCLEEEREFRCETQLSVCSEPSIQELREERCKLEKTVASVPDSLDIIRTMPDVRKRSMPGSPKHILKPLSPLSPSGPQKLRPSPPPSAVKVQVRSRASPLKATLHFGSSVEANDQNNRHSASTLNNNGTVKIMDDSASNINGVRSPSSSPVHPSPPSSAKRGSPTSKRFRQRFREVQQQNST